MAGSVNKVILIGNLGNDPEVRYLEGGQAVANFSLATNRVYNTRDNERREETEWHRVVLWGRQAETAEKYLKKGRTVYIEGRLRTRQWQDKDGVTKYTTEIVGEIMTMLGGQRDDNHSQESNTSSVSKKDVNTELPPEDAADDLPF